MSVRLRMPVPVEITAIVELDVGEGVAEAEEMASHFMRQLAALITEGCNHCVGEQKCDWHRVRFVVGKVGRSLFERAAN